MLDLIRDGDFEHGLRFQFPLEEQWCGGILGIKGVFAVMQFGKAIVPAVLRWHRPDDFQLRIGHWLRSGLAVNRIAHHWLALIIGDLKDFVVKLIHGIRVAARGGFRFYFGRLRFSRRRLFVRPVNGLGGRRSISASCQEDRQHDERGKMLNSHWSTP